MSDLRLSAVVITRDEERNIARCLESLRFCSETIVVDADSTDRTREIALTYTPKVFTRSWEGYSDQKNHANSLASNDWILSVDADETVGAELQEEIRRLLSGTPECSAFSVARKTIHLGRWIRYGGWYPNRLVRLFRRSQGSWVGAEVHERWESKGKVGSLRADLLHYSFDGISDQVQRNDHYSTLGAQRLQREGIRFSPTKLLLKPLSKFLETYLLKRGFLDRYPGFIISVSASYSVFLKWAKLWELEQGEKKS